MIATPVKPLTAKGERGEALRALLYLFERDEAVPLIGAG
jgi:ATP-dependent DNA helicase RecG